MSGLEAVETGLSGDEFARLQSLRATNLLDTPQDARFDIFTRLAARLFGVPISLVTLVDRDRQWFKSAVGLEQGAETPRDIAFCAHALEAPEQILVIEDTAQDPRFSANPLVTGSPGIRFYAGAPVLDDEGRALGTLCVIDIVPRQPTNDDLDNLRDLASALSSVIRMEQADAARRESQENYGSAVMLGPQIPWTAGPDGAILTVGTRLLEQLGFKLAEMVGAGWVRGVPSEERAAVARAWSAALLEGTPLDVEFHFVLSNGSSRWFRSRAAPRTDSLGTVICWYGTIEDVQDRKTAELAAQGRARQLENILVSTTDLVAFYDSDWRSTYMNRPLMLMPAYAGIIGQVVWHALPHLCGTEYERQLRQAKAENRPTIFEWKSPGLGHWVEVSAYPTDDGMSVFLRDVTERHLLAVVQQKAREAFDHQAHHDGLTGLPNRFMLQEVLREKLTLSSAHSGEFALLHLGLDDFKHVNDTLGPAIGDRILCRVAQRLAAVLEAGEFIAHRACDVFAIVQSGPVQPDGAIRLAERLIAAMSQPFDFGAGTITVAASVGIACAQADGTSVDRLLQAADVALYRAGEKQGGTWLCFAAEMRQELEDRQSLRMGLQEGLTRDEFLLFYQPLIDLPSGAIGCFEALMRWRRPEQGMVSPGEFIGLAEESGLILPLGLWALRTACRDATTWPAHIQVAVNLSPVQFRDPGLVQAIASVLAETGLAAGRLKLEITETVLLQDSTSNLATLHALRDLGVLIVLDDFGTGYASLSYLQRFPFDKLKIDQSFIRMVPQQEDSQAIVRSILNLARALKISTVAEGVERQDQLDWLREEGCGQIQGFLFSRPMPSEEVIPYIVRNARGVGLSPPQP